MKVGIGLRRKIILLLSVASLRGKILKKNRCIRIL